MASSSPQPEVTSTQVPYRDNPDDDVPDTTPLLVDVEEETDRAAPRPTDEEQPAAPTENDGRTPYRPLRRFNFVRFHQVSTVFAVVILLLMLAMTLLSELVGRKLYYSFPWSVKDSYGFVAVSSVVTIAWGASNLWRHRKRKTLLPLGVGTLVHGLLAFWLFPAAIASTNGISLGLDAPRRQCYRYWDPDEDRTQRCLAFATKFHVLLWAYVILLFVLALLHTIQFVACLTATYRSRTWIRRVRGGSEHGLMLPGGHISIEFTLRFHRQQEPNVSANTNADTTTTPTSAAGATATSTTTQRVEAQSPAPVPAPAPAPATTSPMQTPRV